MENLLSIEFGSIAKGYGFLNSLEKYKDVEVVEAASLSAGQFWLLLAGETSQLSEINSEIEGQEKAKEILCHCFLQKTSSSVRSALYSLELQNLKKYLGIVECDSVTRALTVAAGLVSQAQCQLIEILNGRGMSGRAVVYFTGEDKASAELFLDSQKKNQELSHFEMISPVGEKLKKYFNSFGSDT